MADRDEPSDKLKEVIDRAVSTGDRAPLYDFLARRSGLPGPSMNLDLARAAGLAIAAHGGRADALVGALTADDDEFRRAVLTAALAARSIPAKDANKKPRSPAVIRASLDALTAIAEDGRHHVRAGLVAALRMRLDAMGEAALRDLASWTDGYLHAHLALEALADKAILAKISDGAEVVARLEEAFSLADDSPRAAERSQGIRVLRQGMPAQIAVFAGRYPEVVRWLADKTKVQRPESREVVKATIAALRRAVISDADAAKLAADFEASEKPRRDAAKVVHGTRKRSKGRM